jgi:hypothetical protein
MIGTWRAWAFGILVIAAVATWVVSSQSFQTCIQDNRAGAIDQTVPSRFAELSTVEKGRACLGAYIHRYEATITTLATVCWPCSRSHCGRLPVSYGERREILCATQRGPLKDN